MPTFSNNEDGCSVDAAVLHVLQSAVRFLQRVGCGLRPDLCFRGLGEEGVCVAAGVCDRLGKNARETVKKKFLLTRYVKQYLDLLNSFEVSFRL